LVTSGAANSGSSDWLRSAGSCAEHGCLFHQLEFGRLLNRKIGWQCALRMRAIYAPASQRSISPNTMSSELMIAVMSASMCPRLKKSIACKWANEGARILHL